MVQQQMQPPLNIFTRNVHSALPAVLVELMEQAIPRNSRNGPVFVFPYPVTTLYQRPWEKVMFWEERGANPFLHFFESLYFLAGRDDVAYLAQFAKRFNQFSDDGVTLHGSYGRRWLSWFNFDQLEWAILRLRADPDDRRVVITMWDPSSDIEMADLRGKDVPCNTSIFLRIDNGYLNMQVNCRSNDLFWGCLGSNAVHFSFLQEYLASHIGVKQGWYAQNSFNLHAYADFYHKVMNDRKATDPGRSLRGAMAQPEAQRWDPYTELPNGLTMQALVDLPKEQWDAELGILLGGGKDEDDGLTSPFFLNVARPLREAHAAYKQKDFDLAIGFAKLCAAGDWSRAAIEWLTRRQRRATPAQESGVAA